MMLVVIASETSWRHGRTRPSRRAAGAKPVFLPPYSPELTPIERARAKLKRVLR
jgi:transposase